MHDNALSMKLCLFSLVNHILQVYNWLNEAPIVSIDPYQVLNICQHLRIDRTGHQCKLSLQIVVLIYTKKSIHAMPSSSNLI